MGYDNKKNEAIFMDIPYESGQFARTQWDSELGKVTAKSSHSFVNANVSLQLADGENIMRVGVPLRAFPLQLEFYKKFLENLANDREGTAEASISTYGGGSITLKLHGILDAGKSIIRFNLSNEEKSVTSKFITDIPHSKAFKDVINSEPVDHEKNLLEAFMGMITNLQAAVDPKSPVLLALFKAMDNRRKGGGGGYKATAKAKAAYDDEMPF